MKILIEQITYNHWANLRLINAAAKLSVEGFSLNVASSFPSVQQTFVHILWEEELWLERWQGRSFIPTLDWKKYPTLQIIQKKIEDLYTNQIQFLKGLNPATEDQKMSYLDFQGEKWEYRLQQMVQHLIIHSAYHRGQLVTLLRQLGIKPLATDYLLFIDNKFETES